MCDGLHRRLRHLLALPATRRRLGLGFLAVMLPEARIHVGLNRRCVLENVVHDSLLDRPPEEVQLTYGGLLNRRLTADLEADALAAAEGVKETLGVRLELALVVKVHHELPTLQLITYIELLAVVRYEPIDEAQRDGGLTCKYGQYGLEVSRLVVKVLEPSNDEVLLALNATLLGLARCSRGHDGVHSCTLRYSVRFRWTQCFRC